ncbi:MAG: ROK family protein [Caulobacteraceae bacterium]
MSGNRETALYAGVELGGSKCICILGDGPEHIVETVRIPTTLPAETFARIGEVLSRWWDSRPFAALGVASFGPIDLDPASAGFGCITGTTKPGWEGADLDSLVKPFGVPALIETDVNGPALAEHHWGAAQGLRSWAYVTLGTGVGVGSVINGEVVGGLWHAEAGHLRVPRGGRTWPGICSFHGDCVEGLVSGPAIAARTGVPVPELPADHPVWDEVVETLGWFFHNLVLATAPEAIIIGGGVGVSQPHLIPRTRAALIDSLRGFGGGALIAERPDYLTISPLGENAGPLGALAVARRAR